MDRVGLGYKGATMVFHDVTGALICGGRSVRFGSDKRLFRYQGKTLLDTSFQKLKQMCHETICVFRDPPPNSLKCYPQIFDDFEIEGPMAGIIAALNYSKTPYIFVLPCDVPNISLACLNFLASLRQPEKIVVLYTSRLEPLIGIYPKSIYAELKTFSVEDNFSLQSFLFRLPSWKKDFVEPSQMGTIKTEMGHEFKNFNRRHLFPYHLTS